MKTQLSLFSNQLFYKSDSEGECQEVIAPARLLKYRSLRFLDILVDKPEIGMPVPYINWDTSCILIK